jgi:secreted effector protein SseB
MNMAVYTEQTTGSGFVNSDAPTEIRYGCALKETSLVGNAMVTMADMMLMFSQLANDKFTQMSKKMDVARDSQDMANRIEIILAGMKDQNGREMVPADIIKYMRDNNILVGDKTIDEFLEHEGHLMDALDAWFAKYDYLKDVNALVSLKIMEEIYDLADLMGFDIYGFSLREYCDKMKDITGELIGAGIISQIIMVELRNYANSANTHATKNQLDSIKTSLETTSGKASDFVQQSQLKLQQLMQNFNTAVTMANSVQSMNAESTKSIAQSIR